MISEELRERTNKELREKIIDRNDKLFFDEIVGCIEVGSYRAAYVMIWVIICESLKNKLKIMSNKDSSVKKAYDAIKKSNKDYDIIDQSKNIKLITNEEFHKLNSIRVSRNCYAHPNGVSPKREEVLCDLRNAVEIVLSKKPQFLYKYISDYINRVSSDPYFLGYGSNADILNETNKFIENLNPNTLEFTLKKLFEKSERLFVDSHDINSEICKKNCLIFTENLILKFFKDGENFDEDYFLDNFTLTACTLFSNIKIWNNLTEKSKSRTFYYFKDKFDKLFIKKFYKLYIENSLEEYQINELLECISNSAEYNSLLIANLDYYLYFDRILNDLKSHNWYIQNPAILFLLNLDLTKFSSNQLEILGRNILSAAFGNAIEAINFISEQIFNKGCEELPYSLIKGIMLEMFVNEKMEFRFKDYNFKKFMDFAVMKYEKSYDLFNDINHEIKCSFVKNYNFTEFSNIIQKLNSLNSNLIKSTQIIEFKKNIIKLRCSNLNEISLEELLNNIHNRLFRNEITPLLEECYIKYNEEKIQFFSSKENLYKLLENIYFDQKDGNRIFDFKFLESFLDLNRLNDIIISFDENELTENEKSLFNDFLFKLNNNLNI